jgi:hypothetical protein
MKYTVFGMTYVIRLDPGEDIKESLASLCLRDGIGFGWFSGIGSVARAEVGFYSEAGRAYEMRPVEGPREVVSLLGNVARVDGRPFIHAHVLLAGPDLAVVGGHLGEAVVGTSCEIVLTRVQDVIGRKKDPATGFAGLDLKP